MTISTKVYKSKEEPNKAEGYNNWNKKYARGNEQCIRWYKGTDQQARRQSTGNHSRWTENTIIWKVRTVQETSGISNKQTFVL